MKSNVLTVAGLALITTVAMPVAADIKHPINKPQLHEKFDFGYFRDQFLKEHAYQLFGIDWPLYKSSTESVDAESAEANPLTLVKLAHSLHAKVVSAEQNLGTNIDMMTLWPTDHPTHLIVCNERGADEPGVQRVRLADGYVETILTGTVSCDPAHATPWGTVLIGEEAGNSGTVLEIIDPLHSTDVQYDRETGTVSGPDAGNVAVRPAIGHLSYEGIAIYPNGVLYYGDENRPFEGIAGGAYFKFVPDNLWEGGAPISSLDQSPLASGKVYGLRLGLRNDGTDYGQGTNLGKGTWVAVENAYDADLRAAAAELKLTGYYRPEDADIDHKALYKGNVRFCANNTGNEEDDQNWGETICVTDGTLDEAANTETLSTPEVQLLVVGHSEFTMMDNIAYQPKRGNWIIHEDGDAPGFEVNPHNNDLWSCLEDGKDLDTLSDGCIRIATLNDLNAEWTGGFFSPDGRHFYVSVQHNVTGHGVILDIYGWK